jgi:hypothetical protein
VAIKIDLVADVKDVIKGTDKIGDALESLADDLKDVGKDGEKIDDKVSDAFRNMGKEAKSAGDKIGKEVKDGTDKAGDGFKDLKEESASTAKESAASFGSIEDAADSLQEILANACVGFGPAGAAAGLAAAIGIGLAITAAQDAAETNTAAKQKAVDMIDAIAEAGGNLLDLDVSDRIKSWGREVIEDNWMTFWADESSTRFQEVAKDAEELGVRAGDAIRAAAGSADDSRKFLDETADDWQRLTQEIDRGTSTTEAGLQVQDDSAQAALKQRNALSDLRGQAEENIKTTENAVEIYNLEKDALDDTKEATEAATEAIKDRAQALEDSANANMTAEQAAIKYVETMQQSVKDIATNGKTIDINTEAGRANRQTMLEMAGASRDLLDAQIKQGNSTEEVTQATAIAREQFLSAAAAAGYTTDEAKRLADQYGLIPKNVETLVKANNIPETEAAINHVTRDRTIGVHLSPDGSAVDNYSTTNQGRKLYVDIAPRGGVGITN